MCTRESQFPHSSGYCFAKKKPVLEKRARSVFAVLPPIKSNLAKNVQKQKIKKGGGCFKIAQVRSGGSDGMLTLRKTKKVAKANIF